MFSSSFQSFLPFFRVFFLIFECFFAKSFFLIFFRVSFLFFTKGFLPICFTKSFLPIFLKKFPSSFFSVSFLVFLRVSFLFLFFLQKVSFLFSYKSFFRLFFSVSFPISGLFPSSC